MYLEVCGILGECVCKKLGVCCGCRLLVEVLVSIFKGGESGKLYFLRKRGAGGLVVMNYRLLSAISYLYGQLPPKNPT